MLSRTGQYLFAAQALALLLTAGTWVRVWRCPCESTIQDAAFWTALVVAQSVVLIGLVFLRFR